MNYPDDPAQRHVPQPQAANSGNRLGLYPHLLGGEYPVRWSCVNSTRFHASELTPGAGCFGASHRVTSANYSRMRAIERRALQSEAMGLCLGAACKLSFWRERLRKRGERRYRAPETVLKLFVSLPRSSDLASRSTQRHRFSNCE
jgi:hypothetical protein